MFLAEPPATAYDLHFSLGPFRIRVTPFFWLVAVLLGWELCIGMAESSNGEANKGVLLILWVAAVFLSILVHELGHALAHRYYGMGSSIVLYHFGGLAIPDSASSFGGFARRRQEGNQIVISAAGPGAQLLLAAAIAAGLRASGRSLNYVVPYLEQVFPLGGGDPFASFALQAFLFYLMVTSVLWALLNLLPVYPLDGGRIAREVFLIFDPANGVRGSLILSIVAGIGIAIYAFSHGDGYLAIMFGFLAFSSFQILQAYSGYGGGRW